MRLERLTGHKDGPGKIRSRGGGHSLYIRYHVIFSSFVQKRILFDKIYKKKMQEQGCLFRKRKGMGSESVLAHPLTKIREEHIQSKF